MKKMFLTKIFFATLIISNAGFSTENAEEIEETKTDENVAVETEKSQVKEEKETLSGLIVPIKIFKTLKVIA